MSSKNTIIAVIMIVALLVVGYVGAKAVRKMMRDQAAVQTSVPASSPEVSANPEATGDAMMAKGATFTLTSSGVTPASVTVKMGESVTWVNSSGTDIQIASDPHPTHTAYPPLNTVGMISDKGQKSLSFPTAGTYKWHDHLSPTTRGTIVVQ